MLNMVQGCRVPFPEELSEGYEILDGRIVANVDAEKLLGVFSAEYLISSTSLLFRPVNDVLQRAALDQRTFYLATNAHNATTRAPLITPDEMRISGTFQLALYKRLLQSNAALYRRIVK